MFLFERPKRNGNGWQPIYLSPFVTGSLFFFRHRKKKQERCHRSESVDDGQRNLSSGLQPKKTALPPLQARMLGPTLRAEETWHAAGDQAGSKNQLSGRITPTEPAAACQLSKPCGQMNFQRRPTACRSTKPCGLGSSLQRLLPTFPPRENRIPRPAG